MQYSITLPIKTVSEANCSQHWAIKNKRHQTQKRRVKIQLMMISKPKIKLPCEIRLTRIAPRALDSHDNLPMSLKYLADALSEYILPGLAIGRADDSRLITWIYAQEKGIPKQYAVRIEII